MTDNDRRVTVADFDIPFGRLIVIFIKIGLAAIPAAIVVSIILSIVFALLGAVFGGFGMMRGGGFMMR
jgi:hypothetical protein